MVEWPFGVGLLKVLGPKHGIIILRKGLFKPEIEREIRSLTNWDKRDEGTGMKK